MSNNIAYLEQKILSSDPVELIQLLYQGAIDAVLKARTFLANGDIAQRSAAISKCMNILAELEGCLNQKDGGEISRNLARLYEYMQIRLLDASMQQADGPLSEVLQLLESLADAWRHVKNPETVFGAGGGDARDDALDGPFSRQHIRLRLAGLDVIRGSGRLKPALSPHRPGQ